MWRFAGKHNMFSSADLGFGEETHIPELLWKQAMQVWLCMNKNGVYCTSFSLLCPEMAYAKDNLLINN